MSKSSPPKVPYGIDNIRELVQWIWKDDDETTKKWLNELVHDKEYQILEVNLKFEGIYFLRENNNIISKLHGNRKALKKRDEDEGRIVKDIEIDYARSIDKMILGICNDKVYIRFYTEGTLIFEYVISIYQMRLVENGIQIMHNIGLGIDPIMEGIEIGWKRNPKRRQFVDLFIIVTNHDQYIVYNKCMYNIFKDLNECKTEYRKILKKKEEEKQKRKEEEELIEMIKIQEEMKKTHEIEIVENEEGEDDEDIEISLLSVSSDKEISLESEDENRGMSLDSSSEND